MVRAAGNSPGEDWRRLRQRAILTINIIISASVIEGYANTHSGGGSTIQTQYNSLLPITTIIITQLHFSFKIPYLPIPIRPLPHFSPAGFSSFSSPNKEKHFKPIKLLSKWVALAAVSWVFWCEREFIEMGFWWWIYEDWIFGRELDDRILGRQQGDEGYRLIWIGVKLTTVLKFD